MEKFIGSVSHEEFIQGILGARGIKTLGDIWDKSMDCHHCVFVTQCQQLGDAMEQLNKHPSCGQIIDMLLGELKPEDIPAKDF